MLCFHGWDPKRCIHSQWLYLVSQDLFNNDVMFFWLLL